MGNPVPLCSVEGCTREHKAHGYCNAHSKRWLRTGDAGTAEISPRARRETTCTVEGCTRVHRMDGLCRAHYQRMLRTGEVGSGEIGTRSRRPDVNP